MPNNTEIAPENYSNWFALYMLSKCSEDTLSLEISSIELGKLLNVSQQTASRRLNDLEELKWIKREVGAKGQYISITDRGINELFKMYENLRDILEKILIVGEVTEGMGEGGYYVSIKGYYKQFKEKLGFEPYKGTLNLKLNETDNKILRELINQIDPVVIEGFKTMEREYGDVHCYDVYISPLLNRKNKRKAAILDIKRTHHKENIIEILAKPYLRDYFNLKDGDKMVLKLNRINEC
ncbi:MAG: Riboflavin kinase [Promethearchaeota archaeon]|jgi:riboflavin kinase|nr:MAG: Riboflavin kinase [Candidatus Lokiarchaeota archaeon]